MAGRQWVRALGRGAAAAVVGGVVSAALTRALMRAITLVTGGDPAFSWVGTLGIAVVHVVLLLPGAVALAYSRRRWPAVPFGAGVLLLLAMAGNIGAQDLGGLGDLGTGRRLLVLGLALAMLAVYGLHAAIVYRVARGGVRGHVPDRPGQLVR